MIEESNARSSISACTQILAGLRFDRSLINQIFREEIMQESVIYQDILLKGEQKGQKKEALSLITRLLSRRLGEINSQMEGQIRNLSLPQLENLAEALLDFTSESDLTDWLANNQ